MTKHLREVELDPGDSNRLEPTPAVGGTMAVNGALVLLLGVLPAPLMNVCFEAVSKALAG